MNSIFIKFHSIFYFFSIKYNNNNSFFSYFLIMTVFLICLDFNLSIWSSNDENDFLHLPFLVYGDVENTNQENIFSDIDTPKMDFYNSSNKEIADYTLLIYIVGSDLEDKLLRK